MTTLAQTKEYKRIWKQNNCEKCPYFMCKSDKSSVGKRHGYFNKMRRIKALIKRGYWVLGSRID
jgi:hypothetical protein